MARPSRALVLYVCFTLGLAAVARAQASLPSLSDEEMEAFLLEARIVELREAGGGVTGSQRATLSDGRLTHDAHIQSVDIAKPIFQAGRSTEVGFKDSYRFNIAGYRLARLLGIRTVPMSVLRNLNGRPSAVTWWVDDVQMDEKERISRQTAGPNPQKTTGQLHIMRVWDELIQNRDRNQGNMLWTSDWTMWLIDHTRAFRLGRELLKPDQLARCERGLLERLRGLTPEALAAAVGDALTREERAAILARRDLIVRHFDDRVAKFGEAILFSM